MSPGEIREVASLQLALVGLASFEEYDANEISGGMQKQAGLAPISSRSFYMRHPQNAS